MRGWILSFIAILLFTSVLAAQLKVDVSLVNVVATVVDDRGRYVSDLEPDDIVVEEDGKVQKIEHFSQSNDQPVSMGVDLDVSGSMERKISTATSAVDRFFRTIHPDDDIFLMTFNARPNLVQDFTSDRDKLAKALRNVRVGGGTALYDALTDSLRKIKKGKQDKKAILLITDGEDTASYARFEDAQRAVRESELLVYCLGIAPIENGTLTEHAPGTTAPSARRSPISIGIPGIPGIPVPGLPGGGGYPAPTGSPRPTSPGSGSADPDSVDMEVLNAFAEQSGGKAWLISGKWIDGRGNQIEGILDEIASELRNQYSIGYYPGHSLTDGQWHRIDIRTKDPHYMVRARHEYFGQ